MNERHIILRTNKKFKLERNTVLYAKRLGGYSLSKLSRDYEIDKEAVRKICKVYARYISEGLLPTPKPIHE